MTLLSKHAAVGESDPARSRRETCERESCDPMSRAFAAAREAALRGEVPVGAAVVRDGVVLAAAGNRVLGDRDPTAHAEMLVIREASGLLGSERLPGCDLYVTLEPCAM